MKLIISMSGKMDYVTYGLTKSDIERRAKNVKGFGMVGMNNIIATGKKVIVAKDVIAAKSRMFSALIIFDKDNKEVAFKEFNVPT